MNRIYHSYDKWECYQSGMYDKREDKDIIVKSIELLSNEHALFEAMEYVAFNWNFSSENFLTDLSSNRRAWLGQAACCLEHSSTELETCKAWWLLKEEERFIANAIADKVIENWEQEKIGAAKCLKLDLE